MPESVPEKMQPGPKGRPAPAGPLPFRQRQHLLPESPPDRPGVQEEEEPEGKAPHDECSVGWRPLTVGAPVKDGLS